MDLRLDHIQRAGQRPRGGLGLIGRSDRDAVGDRRAKALQDLFGLIFMDVYGEELPDYWGELRRL